MLRKLADLLLASSFAVATLLIVGPAAAEDGFAAVNANGTLRTFGGPNTIAAASIKNSAGTYTVTFSGTYPPTTTPSTVVVNTTAESLQFGVSNAVVTSANPAQIDVVVFTWPSPTFNVTDNAFFISVFVGQ